MTRKFSLGQLIFPESIPDSFWVITQGHGVIPDGCRFLVIEKHGFGYWLAWVDGIAPPHRGTLLKEEHFRREVTDDDD